jgi:uncharacterized protein YjbI with pentapeptide repeats
LGTAPTTPYPPDLSDDTEPVTRLSDLVDAVVTQADWANAAVRGVLLRRVEIHDSRMTGADLAEADIGDALFTGCRIDVAGLRMATLQRVVFRDCEMAECDLYQASLSDVLFERCTLSGATLTGASLMRVELRGCRLDGLVGAESLRGARMPWADVVENGPVFAAAIGIDVVD